MKCDGISVEGLQPPPPPSLSLSLSSSAKSVAPKLRQQLSP